MVIGCLKPVVLIPTSLLTGLSTSQVEAILVHELTHIRRHDYVVNLLQNALETLFFDQPALWWVSKQIRREREHCCDDVASAICHCMKQVNLGTKRDDLGNIALSPGKMIHGRVLDVEGKPVPNVWVNLSEGTESSFEMN